MKPTSQHALRLAEPAKGTASRARKQFNTLIKKLDAARTLLTAWKETLPAVVAKVEREYVPLEETHDERLRHLVLLLDEMHGHKLLGKREREKLSKFLSIAVIDLMSDTDDEVLKGIYNRHSGSDFDADEADGNAQVRQMMEELLGTEFKGEIDVRSPEATFKAFQAQFEEQHGREGPDQHQHQESARPKRAADLAREAREAAEAQRIKGSMRDIFRKLASQLHPDRETDPAERERKTALMQRVNIAYAANDMLGLLELQLEVEQIDQASLATLSDERIKQYNKVLKGQLSELEIEVAGFEEMAAIEIGADRFDTVTPAGMLHQLDLDIAELHIRIAVMDEELQVLQDVKMLKAWLKAMPKELVAPQRDDAVVW